jgi:hypothetical protein
MIRPATEYDLDAIVSMAQALEIAEFGKLVVSEDHWRKEASSFIGRDGAFSLVAEHGGDVIGYFAGRIIFEPTSGENVCLEVHWVSAKGKRSCGNELRIAAERLARNRGAKKMFLHCPDGRVERIASKSGYKKSYTIYERAI